MPKLWLSVFVVVAVASQGLFLALKVLGLVEWSWLLVLLPATVTGVLAIAVLVPILLIAWVASKGP